MIVGIVGSEAAKFTRETEEKARIVIRSIYANPVVSGFTSGHCHLGGIDIWAEEEARTSIVLNNYIYPADILCWTGTVNQDGFKERNEKVARRCDVMHCITVKTLPSSYTGMRFEYCYHCKTKDHVKSGGCWTARYAMKLGKPAFWHVIE